MNVLRNGPIYSAACITELDAKQTHLVVCETRDLTTYSRVGALIGRRPGTTSHATVHIKSMDRLSFAAAQAEHANMIQATRQQLNDIEVINRINPPTEN